MDKTHREYLEDLQKDIPGSIWKREAPMDNLVALESDGVQVKVTLKAGAGYDAPWVSVEGEVDAVARKSGHTAEEPARVSDLLKLVPAMARYLQDQYGGIANRVARGEAPLSIDYNAPKA